MRRDEAVGVITATELMGATAATESLPASTTCTPSNRLTGIRWLTPCAIPVDGWSSPRTTAPKEDLGSAVLEVLAGKDTPPLRLAHPAVRIMPGSGTPTELLAAAAIDAASIDSAARHLLDSAHRQSDRQDASTPTAQRRSAEPT